MNNEQFTTFMDKLDKNTDALIKHTEMMSKHVGEADKQQESLAETISFLKVMLKSGNFETGTKEEVSNSVSTRKNIRQEVIDTVSQKQEFIYAQAFHRGYSFKKAQDALISGTNPKSLGPAFQVALEKGGSEQKEKYLKIIKDIKSRRDNGERVDNRNLLGLFSSYATADWNGLSDDSDEKLKYFTMEHYFKNNVNDFLKMSGDSYNRVRNHGSIIKDFQRAILNAWGKNGFGITMEKDKKIKLELKELSKSEIKDYVKLYNDNKVELIGKVSDTTETVESNKHAEKVVESIAESDSEEPEPVVEEKPKKTTRKRAPRSKKKAKQVEVSEKTASPKTRRTRRTRKVQAVVDSDSDSDSDM